MYAVYILLCSDESYYVGQSNDLEKRIWQHETGFYTNCYTFKRRPIKLAWNRIVNTAEEATKLEKQIKGWSRKKKEALIKGDIDELKRLSNEKKNRIEKEEISHRPSSNSGEVDILIVGQGLCGTWLSYYLHKAGFSFLIIDEEKENSASKIAAGIINPVTGRRIVNTWMIDELLPFAKTAYMQMGTELNLNAIEQKNIVDFFPTPQMKLAFNDRFSTDPSYLLNPTDENNFKSFFNYNFGYGEIQPCYLINLPDILPAYRTKLLNENKLLEEKFELSNLSVLPDSISYNNISAQKIIFCDGIASFQNPFFNNLPFAPNKGEVIWIEAKDLPQTNIFKKGMNLVPWTNNIFWVGSSYQWEFEHHEPTNSFREQTNAQLKHWLKVPFKIIDHKAAIRPATLERRPFVGFHPTHPSIGILNGMGTKGCSLAPFFSNQLVKHLLHQTPIHAEASIQRFTRILSRV